MSLPRRRIGLPRRIGAWWFWRGRRAHPMRPNRWRSHAATRRQRLTDRERGLAPGRCHSEAVPKSQISVPKMSDVTHILDRVHEGDAKAAEELLPLVYDELRKLAAHKMAGEAAGQTLQPTALVHETWLRLVRTPNQAWQNRAHFFRTAAECMRQILIDN